MNDEDSPAYSLNDLIGSYGSDLSSNDFAAVGNWGIYQGRPVIIDLGLGSDIWDKHYT